MPAKKITINLLGESDIDHTPLGRIVGWAVTYGRYIMVGTEIVVLLAFISRFSLDRKLTDLNEEISMKQDIITANTTFENEVRVVQDKLEKVKTITALPVDPRQVLSLFQGILPPGIYLESLELSKDKLSIKAVAGSTYSFAQLIANLQSSQMLSAIDIGDIKRDEFMGIKFAFTALITTKKI